MPTLESVLQVSVHGCVYRVEGTALTKRPLRRRREPKVERRLLKQRAMLD